MPARVPRVKPGEIPRAPPPPVASGPHPGAVRNARLPDDLAEQLLHLVEEGLRLRMGLLTGHLREALQQFALLGGQLRGRFDDDAHVLIPALLAVQVRDALAAQT